MVEQVDAVLPIVAKDIPRFKILSRSLNLFFHDLGRCLLVVPDNEIKQFEPLIESSKYVVVPESSIVPEFSYFSDSFVRGWYKQQLIKLAIAQHIRTEFYLTLDADVICVKPTRYADLVTNGRARYHSYPTGPFPQWHEWASRILGCAPSQRHFEVTPSILCTEAVLELQSFLDARAQKYRSLSYMFKAHRRAHLRLFLASLIGKTKPLQDWRLFLLENLPWTEYALYFTFLEKFDLLERFYYDAGASLYTVENSVWNLEDYDNWSPEECFQTHGDFFFCVIQSTTGLLPGVVWSRVERFLQTHSC
jgi:hypothetical protein